MAGNSRPMKFVVAFDRAMVRFAWIPNWTIIAAIVIVAVQASDREPPFELLRVEPAFARPGETVTIYADVWRDHSRACALDVYRSMYDVRGVRWDYPAAHFTAQAIAINEARMPGRMAPTFPVPLSAAPGPAEVVTGLEYRCNKTHALWPIELTHKLPFTVLP